MYNYNKYYSDVELIRLILSKKDNLDYLPKHLEIINDIEIVKDYINKINDLTEREQQELIDMDTNLLKAIGIKYIDLNGLHPIQVNEIIQGIMKIFYKYPKIVESVVCIYTTEEESIRNTYAKASNDYITERYKIYKSSVSGEELETKIDEYVNNSIRDKIDYVANNKNFTASCSYFGNLKEDKIPIQNNIIYRIYADTIDSYETDYNSVKTKYHPDGVYGEIGTTVHELGHAVDNMLAIAEIEEIMKLYEDNSENMEELLSEYAKKNISEFIAEAWSEYILSNNPRELSVKVGDIINKEYKDKFENNNRYKSF